MHKPTRIFNEGLWFDKKNKKKDSTSGLSRGSGADTGFRKGGGGPGNC